MTVLAAAAEPLTLEQCRELARNSNKELQMASAKRQQAYYQRKSAFTNYLPKISATGGYMYTSKPISLLDEEQKQTLPHMGDGMAAAMAPIQQATGLPMGQLLAGPLNRIGQNIVDALDTDTRNAAALSLMLTQPIYMGGKIRAYNNIARLAERAAADQYSLQEQEMLVSVDETYWQIVALNAKKELAGSYLKLVTELDRNVTAMIEQGVATKADGLSVKVKVNQANVTMIQVTNGLELLKMSLCQLCGLDVNTPITLADENLDGFTSEVDATLYEADTDSWKTDRPELRALDAVAAISREKIKLARAETLPTVALTGGYLWTYPSLFDGFNRKFRGMWNVGVAVNIPLITWGDRFYKVKAAKAESAIATLRVEETREKIELQVTQSRQKVIEARERMAASKSNSSVADENLRFATLGLQEGVMPVINVNEAQTAWLAARSELIASQIDLKLAHIHLQKSLGLIK